MARSMAARAEDVIISNGVPPKMVFSFQQCEAQSSMELVQLKEAASVLPLYHQGPDLDRARGDFGMTDNRIRMMMQMATSVSQLAEDVFGMCTPKTSSRIFWEDSERIAFNRGGELFFNAHFAEKLGHLMPLCTVAVAGDVLVEEGRWACPACTYHNKDSDATCKMCSGPRPGGLDRPMFWDTHPTFWIYWFVVFCHELAHNSYSGHNKEHEFTEETLLASFMPALAHCRTGGPPGSCGCRQRPGGPCPGECPQPTGRPGRR